VAYTKRTGRARVVVRSVADGRERVLVESPDYDVFAEDWSRDGRFLAVGRCGRDGCGGLVVPATGGEPVEVVHGTRGIINDEYHFAPDGRWLAYNSDESGRDEVYVAKLPPTGERVQVSSNGGVVGRWRRDGRELFYLGPDGAVMSIDIQPGEVFKASAPRRLFTTAIGAPANELDDYAVSADGQRFLIPIPTRGANVEPINVIVNWSPFARSSMGR
jgi:Tol biopolymer transport system component